jgi:hypothetical protein
MAWSVGFSQLGVLVARDVMHMTREFGGVLGYVRKPAVMFGCFWQFCLPPTKAHFSTSDTTHP